MGFQPADTVVDCELRREQGVFNPLKRSKTRGLQARAVASSPSIERITTPVFEIRTLVVIRGNGSRRQPRNYSIPGPADPQFRLIRLRPFANSGIYSGH